MESTHNSQKLRITLLMSDNSQLILCRPAGVVDRGANCYAKGSGFESWVRYGCKTVPPFIAVNGDPLSGASIIKWSPLPSLVVGQGL